VIKSIAISAAPTTTTTTTTTTKDQTASLENSTKYSKRNYYLFFSKYSKNE